MTASVTCRCGRVVTGEGRSEMEARRHAKAKLDLHEYRCASPALLRRRQARETVEQSLKRAQRVGDEVI